MLTELIIALAYLIFLSLIDNLVAPELADIIIFFTFWFAYANLDKSWVATFYMFGLIFYMIMRFGSLQIKTSNQNSFDSGKATGNKKFTGMGFVVFSWIISGAVFMLMVGMQTSQNFSILGHPSLSIASDLGKTFAPLLSGVLGFVENKTFFTLFEVIRQYFGSDILALLIVVVAFPIFHVTAYGLMFSAMIFAGIVMLIWLILYMVGLGEDPGNNSHFGWNALLDASSKGLSIL